MKILNVNMSIDPLTGGGTAERTFQMSLYLTRAGVDCTVLTTDVGLTPERQNSMENVKIVALPVLFKRFYIPRKMWGPISKIVAEADIIHLMNHWTILNALVYQAAYRLQKPYVICPAGSLPVYGRSKVIKKIYNTLIGNRIIRRANGHIAVTTEEVKHFRNYGISPYQVSVIPNGISNEVSWEGEQKSFRKTFHLNDFPFILFVGRLNPIKGPDLLLSAFCNIKDRIKNVHLVFVGPDEGLLANLKTTANQSGVAEQVHFLGYLGGTEKLQAYKAASLLVVPSRQEAMSIVALEAGINGTPVLLTDQCGFDEVARIGGGMVVPASVDGIQEGLLILLNNLLQLKTMGEKLKRYVSENYLWENVIHQYIALYSRILLERAS
ncbi:MAG: glycosyltransferase [Deltaproteobacteria bacterium]|nr:glycosyltransferase [Deltaproteobacteria bacterium]